LICAHLSRNVQVYTLLTGMKKLKKKKVLRTTLKHCGYVPTYILACELRYHSQ